jgi:hypothetical protein
LRTPRAWCSGVLILWGSGVLVVLEVRWVEIGLIGALAQAPGRVPRNERGGVIVWP